MACAVNAKPPLTPAEHIARAKDELAVGAVPAALTALTHAVIAIAEQGQPIEHVAEVPTPSAEYPPLFMPNDGELMEARGAIISYIDGIARGTLAPRAEVLDTIVKAVVLSLRWHPSVWCAKPEPGQVRRWTEETGWQWV